MDLEITVGISMWIYGFRNNSGYNRLVLGDYHSIIMLKISSNIGQSITRVHNTHINTYHIKGVVLMKTSLLVSNYPGCHSGLTQTREITNPNEHGDS